MRVTKAIVTGIQLSLTDVTTVGESPNWSQITTGMIIEAIGFLQDHSQVSMRIRPTPDEYQAIREVLQGIEKRFEEER